YGIDTQPCRPYVRQETASREEPYPLVTSARLPENAISCGPFPGPILRSTWPGAASNTVTNGAAEELTHTVLPFGENSIPCAVTRGRIRPTTRGRRRFEVSKRTMVVAVSPSATQRRRPFGLK